MDHDAETFYMYLGQENVKCKMVRSQRSRHVALHITPEGFLEVKIPAQVIVPISDVWKFVKEKEGWILRSINKMKKISEEAKAKEGYILFLGREVPLEIIESKRKRAVARPHAGKLLVEINKDSKESMREAIIKFYKKHAKEIIGKIVHRKALEMGVSFQKISLRSQKSRWGSCSSKRTLSFNFCLIGAPQEVIEYVVVHELAHLVHRNHSKAFWALVQKHCQNYNQHRKWLNKNGLLLKRRVIGA
ncbi:MAG: SprT family zinc-dependent metalloprotease [Candidatus Diapherotrites archaeon]